MKQPFLFLALLVGSLSAQAQPKVPVAPEIARTYTIHGETIDDPYWGLRFPKNKAVVDYLKAENRYTAAQMRDTRKLQGDLVRELRSHLVETKTTLPFFSNGYWYYSRYEAGQEYPQFYRRRGTMQGSEELILDEAAMIKQYKAYSVEYLDISHDGLYMAYGIDYTGNFEQTVQFADLSNDKVGLADRIQGVTSLVWSKDPDVVYYTIQDSLTNRSYRAYRHELGSSVSDDVLVYEEQDPLFEIYLYLSKSKDYLFMVSSSLNGDETHFMPADGKATKLQCITPRSPQHNYNVEHLGDRFYILSNWGHTGNNQLFEADIEQTGQQDWRVLIPQRKDVYLMEFEPFAQGIATTENAQGEYHIELYDLAGKPQQRLQLPDIPAQESGVFALVGSSETASDSFRLIYSSMRMPFTTYSYDWKTQQARRIWQDPVPNYNPDNYISERVWATAADGKRVPITLVRRKEGDRKRPCLLEAYGSYGYGSPPYFNSTVLPLLDRGWTYAIAHVRGGDDLGKSWYEDGKLLNKKNTFTDFIACSEHLIKEGYTSNAQLAAMGASAGGLLMGAICNMRPDLYKAVVLGVPFVDVMNTMLDPTLPLTTLEYNEWGNPNEKAYYDYMRSYSPYDNVRAQNYPNMLFFTGIADEQVGYWEPTKMVAKLRKTKTDANLLLLQVSMSSGHAGSSGRFGSLSETAFIWAFLLKCVR